MLNFLQPYVQLAKLVLLILILVTVVLTVVYVDHLRAEIAGFKSAAQVQLAQTKIINDKNIKEASDAQLSFQSATNDIHSYYLANPVRVYNSCGSAVPKTSGDTIIANDTSQPNFLTTYNPEEVELIANQLDQLQKLLVADGVKVD